MVLFSISNKVYSYFPTLDIQVRSVQRNPLPLTTMLSSHKSVEPFPPTVGNPQSIVLSTTTASMIDRRKWPDNATEDDECW